MEPDQFKDIEDGTNTFSNSREKIKPNHQKTLESSRRKKSDGRKVYQVKGAHDKSYLDISQLRFSTKNQDLSESNESVDVADDVDHSTSQLLMGPSVAKLGAEDFISYYSSSDISAQSITEVPKSKFKRTGKFSSYKQSPLIFQGKYRVKSVSETEVTLKKALGFSQISIMTPRKDAFSRSKTGAPIEPKWKYFVEPHSVSRRIKKRGYYSEVVSPLLRPERILANRQKEVEQLRQYIIEAEGKGEEEGENENEFYAREREEFGETIDQKIDKDLLKVWPAVYKVLHPEPVLAEFDLPFAYKEPSLISKGRMPKYAPYLENVPAVTITRSFLHPEENWVVYETEPNVAFPVQAFKPRCYILHDAEPGTLPRKVFIERKRRLYLSQNIEELLAQHGLTDDDLLPPTTSKNEDQFSLYGSSSFLPLEVFDDEGFDPCSVEQWLELGKIDGIQHPIPAVAFVPLPFNELAKFNIGKSSLRYTSKESKKLTTLAKQKKLKTMTDKTNYFWMDIAVTHYHYKTNRWAILTLDGSQTRMYLPRIYVMFRAEDPLNFTYRVMDAVLRRRHAEKLIKFQIYCDCLPLTGLNEIDQDTLNIIYKSITRNGIVKGVEDIVNELISDIQYAHKRILAEMNVVYMVKKYPEMFSFIEVPSREVKEVPDKCLVNTGMVNFKEIKFILKWWWLYVTDETYLGMMHVVIACLKITAMNFFTANFGKCVSLDVFESIQTGHTNNLIKYLRNEWVDVVVTNVRMCLQDVGKGWFNIKEKSWPIYELSKLCRFMELIKYRMQTALKCLVENSTDLLIKIIETPCHICQDVTDENFDWGSDLIYSKFKPSTSPIFTLTLKFNDIEPVYTTNPNSFEEVLLKLFDNAIIQSHTIHQIHPCLLLNLRFPELFLSSIGLMDSVMTEKKEHLKFYINKAIIPLKAYAREYHKYVELYNLDVDNYIDKYAAKNHSANEVKDEILMHLQERSVLESEIPNNIIIGPFFITTEYIRNYLMDKRRFLADRLISYFTDKLKFQVIELNEEFASLESKMLEKPTSIENIFEIKEWLETVPTTVKGYDETIKRIISEYEILDIFWYSLENEDFDNKISLIRWPHRISGMIDQVLEMLAEETDSFYRIQQMDESTLWEKFDWCVAEVQNLMQISDTAKIHETAVQVRKLGKVMKESQEMAALLSSRQKLFGVPVTSFEVLTRLVKDFTPYKDLWLTASDWLKYYEIWMDNPLVTIDGEGIDRLHGDMFKTMQKCQRIFAEVPANYHLATMIKNDIDDFRPYIPLIISLKNPGMKERHWELFLKQTGCAIKITPNLSFKDCLAAGLQNHAEVLIRICETATKEHAIELALDEMEKDWESVELDLQPYKETGTYILKLPDEVIQMLEDHIVKTQQFSFSPFKGVYEQKIDEWEAKLRLISAVFDEWTECQKQWMYLEPIFSSDDITQQLPHESKKFNTMERTWRRIMRNGLDLPKVIWFCPDKRLLESFKECNFLLEQVQKGLTEYLEAKRMIFPRLYFLSDDELLEILSQVKNPLAVQPHLRKCFENIYKNADYELSLLAIFVQLRLNLLHINANKNIWRLRKGQKINAGLHEPKI